eukprot:UN32159
MFREPDNLTNSIIYLSFLNDCQEGQDCENLQFGQSKGHGGVNQYNFIGLHERFDESLIILKFLFKLRWRDVLYILSDHKKKTQKAEFLSGQVYQKISEKLDKLRDELVPKFNIELSHFQRVVEALDEYCLRQQVWETGFDSKEKCQFN